MELTEWREQQEGYGAPTDGSYEEYMFYAELDRRRQLVGDEQLRRELAMWYVKQAIN